MRSVVAGSTTAHGERLSPSRGSTPAAHPPVSVQAPAAPRRSRAPARGEPVQHPELFLPVGAWALDLLSTWKATPTWAARRAPPLPLGVIVGSTRGLTISLPEGAEDGWWLLQAFFDPPLSERGANLALGRSLRTRGAGPPVGNPSHGQEQQGSQRDQPGRREGRLRPEILRGVVIIGDSRTQSLLELTIRSAIKYGSR